jgi:hypothetical protein
MDANTARIYDECYGTYAEAWAEAYGPSPPPRRKTAAELEAARLRERLARMQQRLENAEAETAIERRRAEAWKQRALGEVA